jgi:hypothetical protein
MNGYLNEAHHVVLLDVVQHVHGVIVACRRLGEQEILDVVDTLLDVVWFVQ